MNHQIDAENVAKLVGTAAEAEYKQDALRYQRLRIVGVAPYGTPQLDAGTVLRFTNLDEFVDSRSFSKAVPQEASELAALRDENERLRQQVRERPDQEAIDMALSRAVLAERELAALRRPVEQSREIEAIRKTYKLGPATHTEIERLLSALDLSAQECAGLRIDKQRMQVSLDAAYARLASHDACLAQVRKEMPEVEALRKDTNNGIERGLNGQTTALIAISRLQHWEAAHRAALKTGEERIAEVEKTNYALDEAHRITMRALISANTRLSAAEARERGLRDHVRWLLPMAKGWAAANPVGANQQICNDAEAALAAQPAAVTLRKCPCGLPAGAICKKMDCLMLQPAADGRQPSTSAALCIHA